MAAVVILALITTGLYTIYISISNLISRHDFVFFNFHMNEFVYVIGVLFGLLLVTATVSVMLNKMNWMSLLFWLVLVEFSYLVLCLLDIYTNKPPAYRLSLFMTTIQLGFMLAIVLYMKRNWLGKESIQLG